MAKNQRSNSSNFQPKKTPIIRRLIVTLAWVLGCLVAAVLIAAVLFVSLLNIDGVHRYILTQVQKKATSSLGVPVALENVYVDLPALRVDLYGLTIDGAIPYRTPPLLQVSHIAVGIKIESILRRQWYLNSLEVDNPVLWITRKDGKSNLPELLHASGNSQFNLLSLAIRRVAVMHGRIYVNDHPQNLSARIANLRISAKYDSSARGYQGRIAYSQGQIHFGAMQPIPHALDASFAYIPGMLLLKHVTLTTGASAIHLTGNITHFSRPEVHAQYDMMLDGRDIRSIFRNRWLPAGLIHTDGTITYVRQPAKPLLATLTVVGNLSSKVLTVSVQRHSIPITGMAAGYSLTSGKAMVRDFHGHVLGGRFAAQATVRLSGNNQGGFAKAKFAGRSLRSAERLIKNVPPEPIVLSGTLNGDTSAQWGSRFDTLDARLNAFTDDAQIIIQDQNGLAGLKVDQVTVSLTGTREIRIPLQTAIHARYRPYHNEIEIRNTDFETHNTHITLNGTVSAASSLAVDFRSDELGTLADLFSLFVAQPTAQKLRSLALSGEASFHGQIAGTIAAPRVSGHFDAYNLTVGGTSWKSVRATLKLNPVLLTVEHAYLEPASQGNIHVNAQVSLVHWSFSKHSAVDAAVTMSAIKASDLVQASGRALPVTGIVYAVIHLRGSVARPSGNGQIKLTNAMAYRQPVKSAIVTFSTTDGDVQGKSVVEVAGGTVIASATVSPARRTYSGTISSKGVEISRIVYPRLVRAKTTGILRISAHGQGTLDNPGMNAVIQMLNGSIEGQALPGIDLKLNLDNRAVNATFSSTLNGAPVEGRAHVGLTGDYPAKLSLDTGTFSVKPLLALYAPAVAEQIVGQTQLHLQLNGPIKTPQAIVGKIAIPFLKLTYRNAAQLDAAPIHMDYSGGVLRLNPTSIRGTDVDFQLHGTVPIFSKSAMSVGIVGSVNLGLAQILYPGVRASGIARINIRSGAGSAGGMNGQIEIVNASLVSSSFPTGLQNGNGVLSLSGNRIDITNFGGTVGGGSVKAHGGISFRPRLEFDLGMTAANVRLLYPQGMREDLDANVRLTGSSEHALLGGSVGISDVSFTPGFDLLSLAGEFASGVSAPAAPGFTQNLALNIAVQSTNTLSPASKTMSVSGNAALSVRGTAAHPSLIGRVNLTGGSMIFHGNRFVLTSGTVQFINPNQIRPILNLSLTTTIQQYDIDLRFTGPADQLRGEYTSNPSLPRADIISLLAFGTTSEAQAQNSTPANQAAESLIASQVSSQVTSRISRIAGISQLSISPVLTSGTAAGPPGAVITIRQQVTGNLFITFSTNVASAQDQTIQGQYRLSPRVSVSATRDPNGGFAVDVLIKKSW